MTNQEVFDLLCDAECRLFYAADEDYGNTAKEEAHAKIREALEAFAKATGTHN